MTLFQDVVERPEILMGAKAVWGAANAPVMCFAGRKTEGKGEDGTFYSSARSVALRSEAQPYFVTIGGIGKAPKALKGRALELVRATTVYGKTEVFVQDDAILERLSQWQAAVVISEVYEIVGYPTLKEDLRLPDRKILTNTFDSVGGKPDKVAELWNALRDRPVRRRTDLALPPGLYENGSRDPCVTEYPAIDPSSEEGMDRYRTNRAAERDPRIAREAKRLNRERNGGVLVCESCNFSDQLSSMFDVHHLLPLAAGVRVTKIVDLVVLCPSCHRCAHAKAENRLTPLTINEVKKMMGAGKRSP